MPDDAKFTNLTCPQYTQQLRVFPYPQTVVNIHMCKFFLELWLYQHEIKEIKNVRENLPIKFRLNKLEVETGLKADLLHRINTAIAQLLDYS